MSQSAPLTGITVLDFSRVLAGPMATQILCELGADVIKIERPEVGDESRHYEPMLPHGESAYFFAFNRGKQSLTLNLKSVEGQQIARDLTRGADVLIENFLPGGMDKLGLGYDELSAENPGLVYVSSTGFGQEGPYAQRKGYDTVYQALSGIMSLTGHDVTPPTKAGIPISDMTSALWIAIATLSGLAGRSRDGKGMHVDLAMMDIQVSLLALAASRLFTLDEDPERTGTEHPGRVPSAAFECADGRWLHISASDQHWEAMCRVLEMHDLLDDPGLLRNSARVRERQRVTDAIRSAVAKRKRSELAEALRASDVPVGEVNTVREILEDPNTLARGMVGSFDHPTEGNVPALRTPVRMMDQAPQPAVPPLLGADTESVLSDRLGLGVDEIARLRERGVI